jgi:tryptophan synthase alpha chain
MSAISRVFAAARGGRALLIPFVTAGFPALAATAPLLRALDESGADIIELGVPFSDPAADGEAIQRASERALACGASLSFVLDCARQFRAGGGKAPLVLMGYANSFLSHSGGVGGFARAAAKAGVSGAIVVDLPVEESAEWRRALGDAGLDLILLLAPTTTPARAAKIAAAASGYLYYVSLKGTTGAAKAFDAKAAAAHLAKIRPRCGNLPIAAGFGIDSAAKAKAAVKGGADAVVVGSRLIDIIADAKGDSRPAAAFLRELQSALAKGG